MKTVPYKKARKKKESEWACKPGFVLSGQIPKEAIISLR